MIRTPLRYHRPLTPNDASDLLARHEGDAAILGGGTQLIPLMGRDEIHVSHVVDLKGLGLRGIEVTDVDVRIGALVTYADVLAAAELIAAAPLLRRAASGITGGRALTQQATLVGSACYNQPGTDMPGVMVALEGCMQLHGPKGMREVPARDFLVGAGKVDLRPGEFVAGVVLARRSQVGYCKLKHSAGSWPIATASAVRRSSDAPLRVTLGAVQAVPLEVTVDDPVDLEAAIHAALTCPWADVLAPAEYRASIAVPAARRAVADLREYGHEN